MYSQKANASLKYASQSNQKNENKLFYMNFGHN